MFLLQIGFGKIHDCPQDRRHPNNFRTPLKLLAVWHLVHCKSPILCNIHMANFFSFFFWTIMCFCSLSLNSAKVKKVQPLLLPLSALCDVTRGTKNLNDSSPRWVWPFQPGVGAIPPPPPALCLCLSKHAESPTSVLPGSCMWACGFLFLLSSREAVNMGLNILFCGDLRMCFFFFFLHD